MRNQVAVAILFLTVLLLPMVPVTADNPEIDYDDGQTVFTWSGAASTVELIGEWNWSETSSLSEQNGIWSTTISIDEGLYCYKLIVDGEYIFDPANPYRGYCDNIENSIVRVKDSVRPNFASEIINQQLIISFLPGTSGAGPDGIPSGLEAAIWDEVAMTWTLDLAGLGDGKHTLDLAITDTNGNVAYDHLVPFWTGPQSDFSWEESLIYMIMTDRYINGNMSNDPLSTGAAAGADWMGGDLEGVTSKIQSGYFAELGVNVLWLTPLNTNAQGTGIAGDGQHDVAAYHGYWPVEPRQVDPRLGTADQLKTMVDAAHQSGIRVMMDYVVNHVHQDHTYYQDNPEWFNQGCLCGSANCDWTEHRLDCQFTTYMPDVNWKVRNASEQFIEDALWWLEEFDFDGARIDAVKHVEDLAITNLATRINERFETVGTDYYLKGETAMGWSGHSLADNQFQYDTINQYIGEDSLDGQADFVLYHAVVDNVFTQGIEDYQHLDYWTNRSQDQYVEGSTMVPYVGSHDVPRIASRADVGTGDANNQWQEDGLPGQPGDETAYQAVLQAYGWLLTTPGAPLLYYGDEYGEYGGADPDNRHMYRNMTTWSQFEQSLFDNISQIGQLRAESIALKQGSYSTRYASPDVLIYDMSHAEQNMSIILNRGQSLTHQDFDSGDIIRFGEATLSSTGINIPSNSVTIIELDANPTMPPREPDSHCLIVNNFTMNATYFITLDLTNTCTKDLQYPGLNSSVDNNLVTGLPNYTEWFYMIFPETSYNMSWQLAVNEIIPNGTLINLLFNAIILNCGPEGDWHDCPTSTLEHTFTVIWPSNETNTTNSPVEPQQILGCTDNSALNYQNDATEDDGSCSYPIDNQDNNTDSQVNNSNNDSVIQDNTNTTQPSNQTDLLVKDCPMCCGETIQIPINDFCPVPDCQPCGEQSVDAKSTAGEFVRSALAVAVFVGLIMLFFVSRKK
jgi:glycosidase